MESVNVLGGYNIKKSNQDIVLHFSWRYQAKDTDNNKTSLNKVDDPDNFIDEASWGEVFMVRNYLNANIF